MPNYIDGIIIKKGKISLKCSIKTEQFIKELKKITNDKGWATIEIMSRKAPSDKGVTHYVIENEWKPNNNQQKEEMPF